MRQKHFLKDQFYYSAEYLFKCNVLQRAKNGYLGGRGGIQKKFLNKKSVSRILT